MSSSGGALAVLNRVAARLAGVYRRLADRADPGGAMTWSGLTATIEPGGLHVRSDDKGVRLYYREDDLRHALEQADRRMEPGGLGWIVPPAEPGRG